MDCFLSMTVAVFDENVIKYDLRSELAVGSRMVAFFDVLYLELLATNFGRMTCKEGFPS